MFLSESLSVLQSLQSRDLAHPLIAEILCRVHEFVICGFSIVFIWVPSHVGLAGSAGVKDLTSKAKARPRTLLKILRTRTRT